MLAPARNLILFALTSSALCPFGYANDGGIDELILEDGSRIYGKVINLRDSVLTIETSFAGPLAIDVDEIASLKMSDAATLVLAEHDVAIS